MEHCILRGILSHSEETSCESPPQDENGIGRSGTMNVGYGI
jgi:hypothetical protein